MGGDKRVSNPVPSAEALTPCAARTIEMLPDDDSQPRFFAQNCRHIVLNSYNMVPKLQRCSALKIVVPNCPV